jgi:hypothetical protein
MLSPWRHPASSYAPAVPRAAPGHPSPVAAGPGPAASGPAGRPLLPLPPRAMPRWRDGRPLKRWRYVGLFGPDVMLCVGRAAVGPLKQSFWAVWDRRAGVLDTETRVARPGGVEVSSQAASARSGARPSRAVRIQLALTPVGEPVEVVSPHGRSYIWTRKVPIRADGHVSLGMEVRPVSALGLLDESAGYHARRTEWEWSAGVGTTVDGWPVAWNLVRGVHDAETMSERTVWVHGRSAEVPPVRFTGRLDEVHGADGATLHFAREATRAHRDRLGVISSDYVQPFGRFTGTLPGGVELSGHEPAFGVMERHRARW